MISFRSCASHSYTLARKDYIHKFVFWEFICRTITFQLQHNLFLVLISRKLHYAYSFVIQRITWKMLWELFSWKISLQLHEIRVLGINFASISGWSVVSLRLRAAPNLRKAQQEKNVRPVIALSTFRIAIFTVFFPVWARPQHLHFLLVAFPENLFGLFSTFNLARIF